MPTASIGVAVRKAVTDGLATHLGALSDFNGATAAEREVSVSFGYQFGRQDLTEQVYTGRSRADTPPAGMRSGRNTRNESGEFDLNVMVRFVGGDGYDAEERAEAIGGAVEDWFADRKSNELAVTGLNSLTVASWVADYAQLDGGTAALRTYTVRWTARLE
jgi:hypothetical protein